MAKKNVEEVAVEETVEETAKCEQKFAVHKLREKSIQLFGVSQSTFDGAMHGHKDAEYTVSEVRAFLNEWLYGKRGKK